MNVRNAIFQVQIKMAEVVITLKIMPDSPQVNLEEIKSKAQELIKEFGGEVGKEEIVPVAFGLKSLNLFFVMDESLGGTDSLEEKINELKGVQSVEVIDVRRAIG